MDTTDSIPAAGFIAGKARSYSKLMGTGEHYSHFIAEAFPHG